MMNLLFILGSILIVPVGIFGVVIVVNAITIVDAGADRLVKKIKGEK